MSERKWHKGPPPYVGWWNVRLTSDPESPYWGWFDGEWWSVFALFHNSAKSAADCASEQGGCGPKDVEWTKYYPKNARVPRIDPRKKS